jgi:transcriptional regulator with XRE-family HTH domain
MENKDLLSQIGSRLRERREEKRISLKALSTMVKAHHPDGKTIHSGRLSRAENGKVTLDILELASLCNAMECEPNQILDGSVAVNGTTDQTSLSQLIKVAAETDCPITLQDLEYLLAVQAGLKRTMSTQLLEQLIQHRS